MLDVMLSTGGYVGDSGVDNAIGVEGDGGNLRVGSMCIYSWTDFISNARSDTSKTSMGDDRSGSGR
jgi:hypothetical protein